MKEFSVNISKSIAIKLFSALDNSAFFFVDITKEELRFDEFFPQGSIPI
jgi:hypothetical protein